MDFLNSLKDWFGHTAWPTISSFFGKLVHDEVAAVAPIAEQGVAELSAEEATAIATGDAKDTGHILAKVVASTTQKMQVAGISAGAPSVLAAVGAAAANAPALVAADAPAAQ